MNTPSFTARIYETLLDPEDSDALTLLAQMIPEELWNKGCHKRGYDFFNLHNSGPLSRIYTACQMALPQQTTEGGPAWGAYLLKEFRLLRMGEGCAVPPHFDEGDGVWSLNLMLASAHVGGVLHLDVDAINLSVGTAIRYNASSTLHEISEVKSGTLYMLSAQVFDDA